MSRPFQHTFQFRSRGSIDSAYNYTFKTESNIYEYLLNTVILYIDRMAKKRMASYGH